MVWVTLLALTGGIIIGVIGTWFANFLSDGISEIKLGLSTVTHCVKDLIAMQKILDNNLSQLENDFKQRYDSICERLSNLSLMINKKKEEPTEERLDNRNV